MRRRAGAPAARSGFAAALLAATLLATFACSPPAPPQAGALVPALAPAGARGSNLLLVTLDTTRPDHLGAYGARDAETPVFDALAAGGVRFTEAITPVPVTLPAHASLLTGLDPPRHGLRWNGDRSATEGSAAPSLAERFRAAGYDTGAFVSAFVLDRRFGLDRGFGTYDDRVTTSDPGFAAGIVERPANATVDAALAWLAGRGGSAPWLLWLHLYDAHAAYRPPEPFASRFRDRPYDGEIAFADRELGRLVAAVESRRDATRTAIVVTADHGEGLGEHREPTHSIFLYDATVRIPLVVRPPGPAGAAAPASAGSVVDAPVSLVDLAPTLLAWFDLPPLGGADGLDLTRTVPAPDRALYLETRQAEHEHGWSPLFALRRAADKLILAPRSEYYDLKSDAGETANLWSEPLPPAAEALARELTQLRRSDIPEPERESGRDREAEAKLAALGYLSRTAPATGPQPDPKDRIEQYAALLQANAAQLEGRFAEAARILDALAAQGDVDRSLRLARAKVALRTGELARAETEYRAVLEGSIDPEAAIPLAQILILDRRLDEAEALLTGVEAVEPDHGGLWLARGDLSIQRGRPREALPFYQRAAEVDPYRAGAPARDRIARLQAQLARGAR